MWSSTTHTVHRPSAVRPSTAVSSTVGDDEDHKPGCSRDTLRSLLDDIPLDLSSRSPARHTSVIHGPLHAAPAPFLDGLSGPECMPSTSMASSTSTSLPRCSNPIPSASWLALKLAASTPVKDFVATSLSSSKTEEKTAEKPKPKHVTREPSVSSTASSIVSNAPRMSYPREFKLIVVDYFHANGRNKYRTCKQFQITKSMLNGWLHKIDKIRESRPGSLKSGRSGRRPQFPDIERQLHALYLTECDHGHKPGNRWLRERARELAATQCSGTQLTGMCQFSERWLANFKKRYSIATCRGDPPSGNAATTTGGLNDADSCRQPPETDEPAQNAAGISSSTSTATTPLDVIIDHVCRPGTESTQIARELLAKHDQLPIQSFYERFPDLCKRKPAGAQSGAASPPPSSPNDSESNAHKRGRKVQFPRVEQVLYEQIQEKMRVGDRISNKWMQEEARDIATAMFPDVLVDASKSGRCLFSEHWLHNFKRRFGITAKCTGGKEEARGSTEGADAQPSTSSDSTMTPSSSTATSSGSLLFSELSPLFSCPSAFLPVIQQHTDMLQQLQQLQPGLISSTSAIPLGGIPTARTSGAAPIAPVLPQSSLEWLLLQQRALAGTSAASIWNPYF